MPESAGLAQWEIANLLRINRSVVNMAEHDEWELPGEANIRLLQVVSAMHSVKDSVARYETLPETKQNLAKNLKKETAWQRVKMYALNKKIVALEAKYKSSDKLLLMLTAMEQLHKGAPPLECEKQWLAHQKYIHKHINQDKILWQLQKMRMKLFSRKAQANEKERIAVEMGG